MRVNFGCLAWKQRGKKEELSTLCLTDDKNENSDSECHYLWLGGCTVASMYEAGGSWSDWEECDLGDKKITVSNDLMMMAFVQIV